MNCRLTIYIILLLPFFSFAQKVKTPISSTQSLVRFTENKHQWNDHISFKANLDGGALFIEKTGKLTFHLYDKDNYRARHLGKMLTDNLKFHSYSIDFIGANPSPSIIPNSIFDDYVNFYIGQNSSNWSSNVHHYKTITLYELYNYIDAVYFGGSQSIKYNFIVKPNGNPSDIKMHYNGVSSIKLKNGELYISTSVSESIEQKPYVYQINDGDTIVIPSKFVLENNTVSFKLLKEYDHTKELIIDPLLVFAAQSGSTADNFGMTATYDSRGSLYTGGTAFDVGYPTTPGAYDVLYNGNAIDGYTDVVITKYDSTGAFLKYSTYLGGATSSEIVTSLVADKNDNLCLYGATGSSDFPTTSGCFDNTFNGGQFLHYPQNGTLFSNGTDIYVAKFNALGSTLMASTYLGGSENDGVNNNINTSLYDSLMFNYGDQFRGEIQVDINDEIYIASSTKSPDFPVVNALDFSLNGNQDAILVKLNATLTSIVYSTYIGGDNKDCGNALTLDDSLNVYLTGGTCSTNFYATPGSYKPTYTGGRTDGYICKIKYDGSSILNSTFIGTSNYDQSYFIQLDNNKDVYIFGQTQGSMPVTAGVYSKINSRQFIQKLNNQLDTLLASTIIGNSNGQINISPSAFSVDCAGNIYLSGWGGNILVGSSSVVNMPITANAIQSTTDGHNFYMMVLGPNMSSLLFGSYFGGSQSWEHVDGGTSRFDKRGIIYQSVCAGCANNDDFPVTPGAWPTSLYGSNTNQSSNCNNGVFKVDFQLNSAVANIAASTVSGCEPLTVNFTNNSTTGHSYLWNFGANDTTSVIFNPVKTFTAAGTYTAALYVKKSICDNLYDTARIVITVYPKPVPNFTFTVDSCSNDVNFINQSTPSVSTYKWYLNNSFMSSAQNTTHQFISAGTYTVKLVSQTSFGCKDSIIKTVIVPVDSINISPPDSRCSNISSLFSATGGGTYNWQPASSLSNPTTASVVSNATATTIYTVTITQNGLLGKTCVRSLTTSVTVYPKMTADFTYTVTPCGNTVQFTDASSINPTYWKWDFGDSNILMQQNPSHGYGMPGTYTVSLYTINSFGCMDTIKRPITLGVFTPVVVNPPILQCQQDTVQLLASGGIMYSWQPTQYLSNPNIANPLAFPPITTEYTVTISTVNGIDTCETDLTTIVNIQTLAYNTNSITLSSDTILLGENVSVTLNSFTYNGTLTVLPNTNVTSITNTVITITPTKTGEYAIYFTDQNGCKYYLKTIYVIVKTNECNEDVVYLPTGFTPNNDGINDVLYIRSNFVTEVYLTIYDRWGEKLFETNSINKGWDGIFKGKLLDQGVYGYYMTFKCNNGEESFKKGNITLMR